MQLKKDKVIEIVNALIDEMKDRQSLTKGAFAIHIEDDIEVQVVVTRERDERIGRIHKGYDAHDAEDENQATEDTLA